MLDCPSPIEGEKITGAAPEDTPVTTPPPPRPTAKVGRGSVEGGRLGIRLLLWVPKERSYRGNAFLLQGEDGFTMKKLCVVKNVR